MSVDDIEPTEITVDGDEYNFHLRIREIHTAKQDALLAQKQVEDMGSSVDEAAKAEYFHAAVKGYLMELEHSLNEYYASWDDDDPDNLWTGRDLGEVIVEPPKELVRKIKSTNPNLLNNAGLNPQSVGHIFGLKQYLEASPSTRFRHSFDVVAHVRHKGNIVVCGKHDGNCSNIGTAPMPVSISEKAYRTANQFLGELGLDIPLQEEADGDAGFPYSDLLEEGPPGSGKTPEIEADGGTNELEDAGE